MNEWTIDADGYLQINNNDIIVNLEGRNDLYYINISGDKQINGLIIKSCINLSYIVISNQTNIDTIQLEALGLMNKKVSIYVNNIKSEHLYLRDINSKTIYLNNCEFKHFDFNLITAESVMVNRRSNQSEMIYTNFITFYITNSIVQKLRINFCKIKQVVLLDSCIGLLSIENCIIHDFDHSTDKYNRVWFDTDQKNFKKCIKKYEIDFKLVEFANKFNFSSFLAHRNWKMNSIKIDDVKFKGNSTLRLNFDGKNFGNCPIKTKIHIGLIYCSEGFYIYNEDNIGQFEFTIIYTTNCEGILILNDLFISKLYMKGFNLKLPTSFKECTINNLCFEDFENKSTIKFTNSREIGIMEIRNSELENVIFRPLKVKNNNIKIYPDSFIGGLKIYGSEPIKLEETDLNQDQKHEFYRQFKQAAKNSNNRFLELEYKAKEMAHYKPTDFNDRVMYCFNWIGKHGIKWDRPLLVLLFVNLLIAIPFATLLYSNHFGEFDLFYLSDTMVMFFRDFNFVYFQLLNPISKMSDFSNLKFFPADVSWIVHLLFITSKVLNSVFIYQIVTAFRKWVGKE